jgi:ribosomal protein S18 acetylase RimI-like enzyme
MFQTTTIMTDSGKLANVFRAAGIADVKAIVALVQSAYRGESSRAGWTTEADFLDGQRTDPEEVAELIVAPDNCVVLCVHADELLASAHVQKQGEATWFGMFAVRPRMQRRGIGSALLAEAERLAVEEWRCGTMQMSVITLRTELIAWYERRGYRRTGIFRPFPYGQERYGRPRRDDLRLEVLRKPLR